MTGTAINQRWRERRDSYRPAGETIRAADYEVAEIAADKPARAFVERHHYSASYPAARFRFGLWRGPELVGVAVFSHPCNDRTLTNTFPGVPAKEAVELGRFVLLDDVPGNGETWFLGRCFRRLKAAGLAGVVSFSDPLPRETAGGRVVFGGHVGTIYQAFNAAYLGRGTARSLRLLPDGTVLSDRALSKIRNDEQGFLYATRLLCRHGATWPESRDPAHLADWARTWTGRLCRRVRHPGNFKYAWPLARKVRLAGPSLPYPKRDAAALALAA